MAATTMGRCRRARSCPWRPRHKACQDRHEDAICNTWLKTENQPCHLVEKLKTYNFLVMRFGSYATRVKGKVHQTLLAEKEKLIVGS